MKQAETKRQKDGENERARESGRKNKSERGESEGKNKSVREEPRVSKHGVPVSQRTQTCLTRHFNTEEPTQLIWVP